MPETTPVKVTLVAELPEGKITLAVETTAPVAREIVRHVCDVQSATWRVPR